MEAAESGPLSSIQFKTKVRGKMITLVLSHSSDFRLNEWTQYNFY